MVFKGNGWAAVAGEQPVKFSAGDVVMFPQGDSHIISSAPGLQPSWGSEDANFDRRTIPRPFPITFRNGGIDPGVAIPADEADAIVVCGFLGCDLKPFNPLVSALPRLLHLPSSLAGGWVANVMEQAVAESNNRRPGGEAVLERLSEMMFVDAARRYLDTLPEDATGWLAGLRERSVGKALTLMHTKPDHNWTIEELAQKVGSSRSVLHERFVEYIGQPPMQYLTNWRMQLGAKLLRESSLNVASIALEVGYESEAAFSRAFRRSVGQPPAAWRKSQTRTS